MVKNVYRYMIFSMVAVCCFDAQASQVDKDFINRSKDKNAYAFQQFNKILSNPHRSEVERKCLFDARMAQLALTYTRRFQWLAGFMVHKNYNRCYRTFELSNAQLDQIAQKDLAALIAIQDKASAHKIMPIEDLCNAAWGNKGIATNVANYEAVFIYGSINHLDQDVHSQQIIQGTLHNIQTKHPFFVRSLLSALKKRNDALQQHVKTVFNKSTGSMNYNELMYHQHAQKYLDQPIMSEFKYVAKLQKENGIDKNPATNKFAKLFDRIA